MGDAQANFYIAKGLILKVAFDFRGTKIKLKGRIDRLPFAAKWV